MNWTRGEVERETEQEEEECRAWERVRMLIGKVEMLQVKIGMPLMPTKLDVEPTQGIKPNELNSITYNNFTLIL